ncbi:MAG: hypothetical protein IPG08_10760 [Sphingobacteriaceae bacterium]|nr:hypothetical protein [Sphingobacteriaceae bacterium]
MWVSMPMTASGYTFKNPKDMPCDVRFQINVSKPYRYGYSGMLRTTSQNWINNTAANATYSSGINRLFAAVSSTQLPSNIKTTGAVNNNFPMYSFSTKELAALYGDQDVAKNSLDLIKVVPNPYYGNSTYETKRLDTRVRITNLPNKCTIKIFSLNGTLIKTIKRDVSGLEAKYTRPAYGDNTSSSSTGDDINKTKRDSYVDWELNNQSNIPIASGLYIFHIEAKDAEDKIIGEKIIKWLRVMRPLDLQNY